MLKRELEELVQTQRDTLEDWRARAIAAEADARRFRRALIASVDTSESALAMVAGLLDIYPRRGAAS